MDCGEHGPQADDLAMGKQFKDLSFITPHHCLMQGSCIEKETEVPCLPRDLAALTNPPLPAVGRNSTIEFNDPGEICHPLIYPIHF